MNSSLPLSPTPVHVQEAARIDDIECLRAFAIVSVLIQHMPRNLVEVDWLDSLVRNIGFWAGVDLFFAISGFVIARSLLPQLRAARDSHSTGRTLAAFWIRRAFRLLPSAWLWLFLILVAVIWLNDSGLFGTLKDNLWATAAALANIANFRLAHHFMSAEAGASAIYWSLSLEEQFYLLLPLLALALRKHLPLALLALIALQALRTDHTFLSILIRTDALAWGVLLAIAYGSAPWRRLQPAFMEIKWLRWCILFLLFGTLGHVASNASGISSAHQTSLVAVLSVSLVWIASYRRNYISRNRMVKPALMWIGSRSYAIYLIHIPVYLAVQESFLRAEKSVLLEQPVRSPFIYAITAMILIFLLAEMNYRMVELPFRRMGARLAARIQHRPEASPHFITSTI